MSQRRIDSSKSEMGKGSEHRRVKEKRVSRVQRGTDVSEGEMGRGSECHQVKRKRVKKERASRVYGGVYGTRRKTIRPFHPNPYKYSMSDIDMYHTLTKIMNLKYAKKALEFY
ncbi:uncharacterized protein [Euphorbia lathyris]|uniref:uncharacterized protein isoform X4 n=1 Tax=Euphorbia lathyris TaxID=212925 RepID=UPI0033144DF9